MAMPDITNLLDTDMRSKVASYRELVGKAVRTDDSPGGIVAALERFFHKLEFLLKEGYLPSTEDIDEGGRLPPELRRLKAFLGNGKTGDSYVLQRNDTERYCFSWQSSGKLTVAREEFHASTSIAAAHSNSNSNYITKEWRRVTVEDVKTDLVMLMLDCQTMTDELESLKDTLTVFQKSRKQSGEPDKFDPKLTIERSECGGGVNVNFHDSEESEESERRTRFSCSLSERQLRWAALRGVDLSGVSLSNADLSGVDLSGAILGKAKLFYADLRGVDLSGVDLTGADLRHADLTGANLSGAILSGA
ncbi:pentapeptide repeat-containing protein, partial [Escherichia coli]|nr:pentapeptide repeat-containing protein [Escherichia coli]